MNATENFYKWAAQNFSGCDGSNVKAPVWVCGIEWGAGKASEDETVKEYAKYKDQIAKNEVEAIGIYEWEKQREHQYSFKFEKLYAVISGQIIDDVNERKIKYTGNEVLKLNLYPIFFRDTSPEYWKRYNLEEITGFKNKDLYMKWCHINRAHFFRNLVKKNKPKLIICCGLSYADAFLNAFVPQEDNFQYIVSAETFSVNKNNGVVERYCYYTKTKDETHIFIVPFFGYYKHSLNSDELIQKLGELIVSKVGIIK